MPTFPFPLADRGSAEGDMQRSCRELGDRADTQQGQKGQGSQARPGPPPDKTLGTELPTQRVPSSPDTCKGPLTLE